MSKRYIFLLFFLFFLNLADVTLTFEGLKRGAAELNPIFTSQTLAVKLTLPLLFVATFIPAFKLAEKARLEMGVKLLKTILIGLVIFYFALVVWNLAVLVTVSFS